MENSVVAFASLPEDTIRRIIRYLDAKELAILGTQSKELKTLASEDKEWERLSKRRWCKAYLTKDHSTWLDLYRHRASFGDEDGFFSGIDEFSELTERTCPTSKVFKETLKCVSSIHIYINPWDEEDPLRKTPEYAEFLDMLKEWVEDYLEDALQLAEDTKAIVSNADRVEPDFDDVEERISSMSCLADLLYKVKDDAAQELAYVLEMELNWCDFRVRAILEKKEQAQGRS